jgi:hypothetical protein
MIELPERRVGPYIRALRAGLRALAPDRDHASFEELDVHLESLDPAISTSLLLPAQVDAMTGLPDISWMDRVRAERAAADEVRPTDPKRIAAIRSADPVLARRLTGRVQLLEWLKGRRLAQDFAVEAAVIRRGKDRGAAGRRVRITMDRRLPRAGWTRVRLEVDTPERHDGVIVQREAGRVVTLHGGFSDLLARHAFSPLAGLHRILSDVTGQTIHRLSRGVIGPFWFPGGPQPTPGVDWAHGALVLQLGLEVIGREVRTRTHHDPLSQQLFAPDQTVGTYRGRRFAVSPQCVDAARAWCASITGAADVVPLVP